MTRWRPWISTVAVVLACVLAVTWLLFRYDHKSWAWWQPPAVLHVMGRDYERGGGSSETLIKAEGTIIPGNGIVWRRIGREWPMLWTIWASVFVDNRAVPTVIFIRTDATHFVAYGLEGGP